MQILGHQKSQSQIRLHVSYSEGMWTVIAKFDHWKQNTFTAPFEVKKYGMALLNVPTFMTS